MLLRDVNMPDIHELEAASLILPAMTPPRLPEGVLPLPGAGLKQQAREQSPTISRRVLVADDNIDALECLAMLLEMEGHTMYTAGDGQQSLEAAERHRPEIIVLDLDMPVLDGYEVARRIRAQPWGRAINLIALTGWGQDFQRRLSREVGFDAHLVKPLNLDDLRQLLARGLPHRVGAP
jgi:CheY-like chemotaxis protein